MGGERRQRAKGGGSAPEMIYRRLVAAWTRRRDTGVIDLVEKRLYPLIPSFIQAIRDREMVRCVGFGEEPLICCDLCEEKPCYLPHHGVHVAIIAATVAAEMGYSEGELKDLSLVALVHDIGMSRLPPQIWEKRRLSATQMRELRLHPIYGQEMLEPIGPIATVVLQEHERMDGSGYPKGISVGDIHEFAYIIGIADVYNSLIRPRPYRSRRYTPFTAIREITTREKGRFPASVLKPLISLFLLPIGCRVVLNSGERAEVIEVNMKSPLRPIVKVTHDHDDRVYKKPRILDLERERIYFVVEVSPD